MARKPKKTERRETSDELQYFELVNWTKAQPNIPDRDAPWVKLYTSLLDNDAFGAMDDSARMLIVALWLYAGRSGRHVFPADPKWLRKKISMLNQDPDLTPLLEAKDAYGEPKPFVRIVDKKGIYNVLNHTEREKREKTKSKSRTLTGSEKKTKKKERAFVAGAQRREKSESQKKAESQTRVQPQTADQTRPETESPSNPMESEGGGAARAPSRKPPHFDKVGQAMHLGKIPIWWSDPACKAFSYEIFRELGLKGDPESEQGKGQRGTFAAWLFEARAKVPMADWAWLEEKAIAKAREIARYGKAARKPGAVWLTIMHKELQARAGPASAMG